MVKIIEGFLPGAVQDEIEKVLFGWQFDWNLYANTNHAALTTQPDDAPQFVHGFTRDGAENSKWKQIPDEIVKRLGWPPEAMMRAKANLLMRESAEMIHPAHTDDPKPHWVMVYYVNDADGDTCLFEGDKITHRISPKKGRAVVFDGRTSHASSSPVKSRFRSIINFNLMPDVDIGLLDKWRVEA